ncbi:MAG: hypothetical protein Q8Q38_02570 [bacterium]|nr:hypothetical protein [bacterium]
MRSRWYELKEAAVGLRKRGLSIGKIERRLGIPRSTLSGWFKNIELSPPQKEKLQRDWKNALVKARKKASVWHSAQKQKRLEHAENEARQTLRNIEASNPSTLELALSLLYFGEGSKKNCETALGSSDPTILKFFLACMQNLYGLDPKRLRYELYLRADQSPQKIKMLWARELDVPSACFKQINIDKRTNGSKTYPHYHGVCNIRCGNVAIQRKLMYLSKLYCAQIIGNSMGT